MEKEIIGEILNKRIAEKGYTQQEFADLMGMKKDTLRSYMNGSSAYSYELLIEFAEKLDCSYDYLLGYSKSPNRDYHEITEQTRLSEEAISKISKYAKEYDTEYEAKKYITLLDRMITEDRFLNTMFDYIIASKYIEKLYKDFTGLMGYAIKQNEVIKRMDIENDYIPTSELIKLTHTISDLKDFKRKVTPEMIELLKEFDTEEKYYDSAKKVKDAIGLKN